MVKPRIGCVHTEKCSSTRTVVATVLSMAVVSMYTLLSVPVQLSGATVHFSLQDFAMGIVQKMHDQCKALVERKPSPEGICW